MLGHPYRGGKGKDRGMGQTDGKIRGQQEPRSTALSSKSSSGSRTENRVEDGAGVEMEEPGGQLGKGSWGNVTGSMASLGRRESWHGQGGRWVIQGPTLADHNSRAEKPGNAGPRHTGHWRLPD